MSNKNKESINLMIEITEKNIEKYKAMLKLKTSKCSLREAFKDTLVMNTYLDATIKEKK